MANIPNRFTKGIVLRGESSDSGNEEGSLFLNSSSARIKTYVEGAVREVITSSQGQYLTNKTISTAENTIQVSATGVTATELDAALEEIQGNIASSISENLTFVKTDGSRNMTGGLTIANPSHVATLQLLEEDDTVKLNYVDTAGIYGGGTFTTDIYSGQIDVKHTSDGLTRIGTGYIAIENGDGSPRIPVSNSAVTPKKYVDDLNLSQIKNKQDLVDIFFDQTFEFASLANFTHTGLILTQTDPLHGNISALLTHQAGTSPANDQFFKEIIPVDRKFRGQTMVLRLDSKSSASQGNVVINIKDETNSANLVASEQLQLSNDVNGKRTSVSFTIPETCASLSYTITALPESGSPTTRIDDIICELAETALLETAVVVPVVTAWQRYTPTFQGFGSPTNIEFEYRQVGENVEIRGKFATGTTTAAEARVGLPAGLTSGTTALIPSIQSVGSYAYGVTSTNAHGGFILAEPSVSYITFSSNSIFGSGSNNPLTKVNANSLTISSSGETISLFASVPCAGLSATTTKTIPLTQSGLVQEADSMIRTTVANGFGSPTGTMIRRFLTNLNNIGNDVVYQDSSINGASFTIQEKGTYLISYNESNGNAGGFYFGITKNAPSLSTSITSITDANIMLARSSATGTSGLDHESVSWQGILEVGDIIRPHTSGLASTGSNATSFTIAKQGSLKQVSVNPNSKITIPTSELRFEGASARGTTDTAIVRFDNIAKLRGDAFTVESDAVLGTRITMKKAGLISISSNLYASASRQVYITKNQAIRTTDPVASEILASEYATAGDGYSMSYAGFVSVGDVVRVAMNAVPTANAVNNLNLSFQEQDISVSVTNTLPQFSESDSSVRVDTANGYGSTGTKIRRFSNVRDNIGTDIKYVDDPANGAIFTVKSSGIYNISYSESGSSGFYCGLSKNSSSLSTNVSDLPDSEVLAIDFSATVGSSATASWQGYLLAGDVIRPHTAGTAASINPITFTISKVGKPNVTGVDVTPFVNIPQPESQHLVVVPSVNVSSSNILGNAITSIGSGLFSYNSSTGVYTVLKRGNFNLHMSGRTTTSASTSLQIFVDEIGVSQSDTTVGSGYEGNASYSAILNVGSTFRFFCSGSPSNASETRTSVLATALSDQILTAPETFSTDTASLTYAGSASYTLSTLQNAPVGTFITFTYAANTNTRTQTVNTAPTQFASGSGDANANGIQIFTRAFNATSSAAQPAAIAIQIGKGLKGKSLDLYKNTGKSIAGSIDYAFSGATASYGIAQINYSEITGILYVDSGWSISSSASLALYRFSDASEQSSGYLVINASKNPVITGFGLNRIAARGVNSSGLSVANTGYTTLTYDSIKTFDTYGALNTSTGVFTAPETGYYQVQGASRYQTNSYAVNNGVGISLFKNGVEIALSIQNIQAAATIAVDVVFSDTVFLAKGDTIYLALSNGRTAGATPLNTVANQNYFSIVKTSV